MGELAGRTALVTGAGNGLGRAIAIALAKAGARVILTGRTVATLTETAALLPDAGRARVAPADVSSAESVAALRDSLSADAGEIDLLVNNAGIGGPVTEITDIQPAQWDEVFGANVRSVYLMCRAFLPAMYQRGSGDVVNIGLTRTLAFEAGPRGVRVNSLSPGPCRGQRMTRNFTREAAATGTTYEQAEEAFVARSALHRLVEEDEVAAAVLAMLRMPGLCGADIDLSAGMIAPA
jgi:NAD(P)-dependent dehydrogenase (short-subunit alcohol dehydrogenase family)